MYSIPKTNQVKRDHAATFIGTSQDVMEIYRLLGQLKNRLNFMDKDVYNRLVALINLRLLPF